MQHPAPDAPGKESINIAQCVADDINGRVGRRVVKGKRSVGFTDVHPVRKVAKLAWLCNWTAHVAIPRQRNLCQVKATDDS